MDFAVKKLMSTVFKTGYDIHVRFLENKYQVSSTTPWTKINQSRGEKVDINFRKNFSNNKTEGRWTVAMDRYILRSRKNWVAILRSPEGERIIRPTDVTGDFITTLQGKDIDLLLRRAQDARIRISAAAPKIPDTTSADNIKINVDLSSISHSIPADETKIDTTSPQVFDLIQTHKSTRINRKLDLFGPDSDDSYSSNSSSDSSSSSNSGSDSSSSDSDDSSEEEEN